MSRTTASKILQHEPERQEGGSLPTLSSLAASAVPRAAILALQHTAGNRAVSQWLQASAGNSGHDGNGTEFGSENSLSRPPVMLQSKSANGQAGGPSEQQADRAAERAIQRPEAEAPARPLIVEDEVEHVQSGQMRKGEFLSELKSNVCTAAEEALRGTIWSAMGCPYIERWFDHYSGQDSQHVERALRKYASETAGARTAREYIPMVTQRVRRGIAEWTSTGEVTGLPEELAQGGMPGVTAAGLMGGLVGGALAAVGSAVSGLVGGAGRALSGVGRMLFKGREGGARDAADPAAIQSQLGSGHSLDGGVKARMESAFGANFSGVRIHTDARSQELSDGLNARAFTIGRDIAFSAGEYQPGTLIGEALIAHELAHVVQQEGATSSASPMTKGGAESSSLEEDADISAMGAVVSLWSGAQGGLTDIGKHMIPRLRSGLQLQRCGSGTPLPANIGMSATRTEPGTAPAPRKPLLDDFATKFPDSAALIRQNPESMKLIGEAESAGVQFGGYSEEGPRKVAWPYTSVKTVYIPRAQSDKIEAMASFLFELNNAIRQPQIEKITERAIAGNITAKEFARQKVEVELEGMLRLGEIWIKTKESGSKEWDRYDDEFYLSHYQAIKSGKKTKDQVVNEVLQWKNGVDSTKTNEEFYMEQYFRYKKFQSGRP
jgi:uncharacterized protein DUF4157